MRSTAEIIGCDEVIEMLAELVMTVVMITFDGGFLDGAVHSLDLAVGPWMVDLGEAVLDAVFASSTPRVELRRFLKVA